MIVWLGDNEAVLTMVPRSGRVIVKLPQGIPETGIIYP